MHEHLLVEILRVRNGDKLNVESRILHNKELESYKLPTVVMPFNK
jgi:hypothetical protein